MFKYFIFVSTGTYNGYYEEATNGTAFTVNGSICQPADIVKFDGTDWTTTNSLLFLSDTLTIKNLIETDWNSQLKEDWLKSYIKYVGLGTLSNTDFNLVLQEAENINLFYKLSNPSIAYVNKDLVTNEVSISMNVYDLRFIISLGNTLPSNSSFRNLIYLNHKATKTLVSNLAKVEYMGSEHIVWCFDGIEYDYTISETTSLENGGGNIFGIVKLAGDGVATKYIVRKNIDPADPTVGLCSGEGGPFCMGDEIHLIDTTVWTTNDFGSGGTSWTWLGDYSQLKYEWYIADITDPCKDYRNYGVEKMKFPIRVIQFCEIDDFNYSIEYFYYPINIETDIIVRINENVFWYEGDVVTISDFDNLNSYYANDWEIVSKGTDQYATNNENDSNHFRLRKNGFDNTTYQFPTGSYKIYFSF